MRQDTLAEIDRIIESLAAPAEPLGARFESPAQLQQHLYVSCFCRRLGSEGRVTAAAGSLLDELSRANAGHDLWDPGWRIDEVPPAGRIRASRHNCTRTF